MAKPINYQEIEKRLSMLKEEAREADIPYILLGAFGTTYTYIKRYKEGKEVVNKFEGVAREGFAGVSASADATIDFRIGSTKDKRFEF